MSVKMGQTIAPPSPGMFWPDKYRNCWHIVPTVLFSSGRIFGYGESEAVTLPGGYGYRTKCVRTRNHNDEEWRYG